MAQHVRRDAPARGQRLEHLEEPLKGDEERVRRLACSPPAQGRRLEQRVELAGAAARRDAARALARQAEGRAAAARDIELDLDRPA